jgi:hypothetical protein
MVLISEGILKLLSRNQNQDGCHGGHLVLGAGLNFKKTLPFFKSIHLTKYGVDQLGHSQVIVQKPKPRRLTWQPSCFRCGAEF